MEALENEETFTRPDATAQHAAGARRPPSLRERMPSLKQGDADGVIEEDAMERLKMTEKLISELNESWEDKHMRTNVIIQQR